jgi:hypothetical protein
LMHNYVSSSMERNSLILSATWLQAPLEEVPKTYDDIQWY